MKTFMLLLAFSVTDPTGSTLDETVHVLSRHFDEKVECTDFVNNWGDVIRTQGPEKVTELLKEDYKVELLDVRCVEAPPKPEKVEEEPLEEEVDTNG